MINHFFISSKTSIFGGGSDAFYSVVGKPLDTELLSSVWTLFGGFSSPAHAGEVGRAARGPAGAWDLRAEKAASGVRVGALAPSVGSRRRLPLATGEGNRIW
ncbi:MAG: hypothetical protein AAGC95_14995 [Pseudomonadota bacterium]